MECSLLLHDATGDRVIPFAANALQCFVNGEENPKTAPFSLDFVTLQEDRATAIGNMHRKIGKDRACGSGDMLADRQTYRERERERERQTDRQTDTQTYSSQYFATSPAGEVITVGLYSLLLQSMYCITLHRTGHYCNLICHSLRKKTRKVLSHDNSFVVSNGPQSPESVTSPSQPSAKFIHPIMA